jgi:hypothetical protein
VSLLGQRLIEVDKALTEARLEHAFGGAIALAYCTEEPRGTRDLDVNIFVAPERAREALAALPAAVSVSAVDIDAAEREGQVRVWWGEDTPIDLFLDIHDFHREVEKGVRWVSFEDRTIPVLGCVALAVFKALFDRTKDWADIEAMVERGSLNVDEAVGWLERLVGSEAPAVRRMVSLGGG